MGAAGVGISRAYRLIDRAPRLLVLRVAPRLPNTGVMVFRIDVLPVDSTFVPAAPAEVSACCIDFPYPVPFGMRVVCRAEDPHG